MIAFSLAKSKKIYEDRRSVTPSPGQYNAYKQFSSPAYSLGKDKKATLPISATPGPGQYSPKVLEESLKFSISGKTQEKKRAGSPGPAQYSPNSSLICEKSPNIIFGTEKKLKLDINDKLPPAELYKVQSTLSPIKISFPRSTRDEKIKSLTPGPGHYTIKSTLGKASMKS